MFANFSSALSIERENVMFMQRAIICTARGPGLPLIGHWITILGSHWPGRASLNITSLACGGTSPASHFSCSVTARLREGDPPASSEERSDDSRHAEKGPAPSEAERTQAACVAEHGPTQCATFVIMSE